jgi:hypothetical protein
MFGLILATIMVERIVFNAFEDPACIVTRDGEFSDTIADITIDVRVVHV